MNDMNPWPRANALSEGPFKWRRSPSRAIAISLVLLVTLGGANLAWSGSAAVLGIGGDQGDRRLDEIGDLLLEAVENNPALEPIDRRDLSLDELLMLLGCVELSRDCMAELAATLETDHVLYADLVDEDGTPILDLYYFDVALNDFIYEHSFDLTGDDHLEELELRLAAVVSNRTVLRVVSDFPGVEIQLDGVPFGQAPVLTTDLEPGRYQLTANCDDCEPLVQTVLLAEGRFYTERMNPEGAGVVDVAMETDDDGDDSSRWLPAATIGLGGALLATGVVFAVMTAETQDEFDLEETYSEAEALADKGETYALLTNVFLASGGAIAATGIVLFLFGSDEPSNDNEGDVAFRATPWATESGGGMLIDLSF